MKPWIGERISYKLFIIGQSAVPLNYIMQQTLGAIRKWRTAFLIEGFWRIAVSDHLWMLDKSMVFSISVKLSYS